MADSKISQLTSATTPLAGTEVLPIVQSGVTKKVAISDVTAGRSTSMSRLFVNCTAIQNANDTSGTLLAPSVTQGAVNFVGPASYTGSTMTSQSVTPESTNWYHFIGQSGNGSAITTNNVLIFGNGNIQNSNNSYGATSDIKVKENIVDATPKLDELCKVRVVSYNLKTAPGQKQLGVIAQELEQIFPGMVEELPDHEEVVKTREVFNGDVCTIEYYTERVATGTTTKSVKYSVFVPMLIKAIQEQQKQIDNLTNLLSANQ